MEQRMNYQLITDATADIPAELQLRIPELKIIPMEIVLDGKARAYGPDGDLSVSEFYKLLRSGQYGSTSQITPAVYRETFEQYLEQGKDILYLCFSSGMSATWQNACMCAEELKEEYPDREIRCVDTLCACAGEGFLVYEAAKKWLGGESLDEVAKWTKKYRLNVCHWFTVDTLKYLEKGGRISKAAAAMGTALQIKPLLRVDESGKLIIAGKPRGRRQPMEAKIKEMGKSWLPEIGRTVFIAHGDAFEEACRMKQEIQKKFPLSECYIVPVSPVIGIHTGPGMQAIIFWGKNRRSYMEYMKKE